MATINGIYDSAGCIKIILNGNVIFINKVQVKTVDIIRNDTVRLDIGQGSLRNIYTRLSEVSYPEGLRNITELRDYISGLIKTDVTANPAIDYTAILQDIKNSIQLLSAAHRDPLREDESQPSVVYKGYAAPNVNNSEPLWAIIRISKIDNQIIYEWADGDENYDNIWDSRYELQYFPSGFERG